MGGLLILLSMVVSTLLWADLSNRYVWIVLLVTLSLRPARLRRRLSEGHQALARRASAARFKLGVPVRASRVPRSTGLMQLADAAADRRRHGAVLQGRADPARLGVLRCSVAVVIVGAANAVNLTDGLDGLAIVPVMIAARDLPADRLSRRQCRASPTICRSITCAGTGELAVFLGALVGAGLGFLWYNAPPAMVFMGDTGSLSLGGVLGAVAVAVKHEIVLAIVGGLFVLEAVSVIVQVISFKITGKRVFRMAPIHHHFEQLGWSEPTIVIRFWIIAVVLALIGLSTLKLR